MSTKAQPKLDVQPPAAERKYIINSKQVDKHNIVRTRIEFTPAVCEQCGFDVCGVNNLGSYWDLSVEEQERVKEARQKHIERAHGSMNAQILGHNELPGHWLGEKMEGDLARRAEATGKTTRQILERKRKAS